MVIEPHEKQQFYESNEVVMIAWTQINKSMKIIDSTA